LKRLCNFNINKESAGKNFGIGGGFMLRYFKRTGEVILLFLFICSISISTITVKAESNKGTIVEKKVIFRIKAANVTTQVFVPPVTIPPTIPQLKYGWNLIRGKWYYGNVDGDRKFGWVSSNDKWYYLGNDGIMETGWVSVENKWYFLNNDGAMQTGWVIDSDKWYYLYDNGSMAANTTINGYKLGASGAWIN